MNLNRTEELHLCCGCACGCCDFTISRPGLGTHNTNPIKSRHNQISLPLSYLCGLKTEEGACERGSTFCVTCYEIIPLEWALMLLKGWRLRKPHSFKVAL
ncbi:hypothetical protein L3X38_000471 [Prunus dulcis]|uniref:Uncharacterized protein n=1 Tax=Prunus dulcis TaxID=3755 RepID=A0AAD4WRS3_PRUDU|nr:hypothetical protein L3X38_000471 [Prunus dulcis]